MFGYKVALFFSAVVLVPSLVGLVFFKRFNPAYKAIAILLICGAFSESLLITLSFTVGRNLYVHHFLAVIEIFFLSLFYMRMLGTQEEKKIIQTIMTGLCLFAIIYASIGNNIVDFNSVPRAFESMYFCGLSCYLFYRMSADYKIGDHAIYFVNGAVFFYFASNFLVFAFSKYKETDNSDLLIMFNVHSIVDSSCNLAYARGLWLASRSSYSVV
jgi:hypothetical protein